MAQLSKDPPGIVAPASSFLKPILDVIPLATVVLDDTLRIIHANAMAEKLFGGKGPLPASGPFGDLISCAGRHTGGQDRGHTSDCRTCPLHAAIQAALTGMHEPAVVQGDTLVRRNADHADIRIRFMAGGIVLDGRTAVVLVLDDVTEQHRRVAALSESEKQYRSLFENAVAGIFRSTPGGRLLAANPYLAHLMGFDSPQELMATLTNIGRQQYADPQDREILKRRLEREGMIRGFETRLIKKDGTSIWAHLNARVIRDKKGSMRYFEGTIEDITERKRIEKALRESEKKYRELFENAPVGVFQTTSQGRFLSVNPEYARIAGYADPADMIARITDIASQLYVRPEERDDYKEALRQHGQVRNHEVELKRPDGQPFWVSMTTKAYEGPNGQMVYDGFLTDVTERKRAEQAFEKLQAQLNQAQKLESVGRLAGGVAHDFNNMLGVILGRAELAMARLDPAQPIYNDLMEIQKAAQYSATITQQLLGFARKQTVAPRTLDLSDTVAATLQMLRRLIGEDIDLVWLPGENLAPVLMDPSQLDQILANLCINARDAIPSQGKITIETAHATFDEAYCATHAGFVPGEYVLLAVSDDGCGIEKQILNHIFEPFFTTKQSGKGTGLGLATVYGIVKQNNGFINVYSEPGQGTRFTIYLPRHTTSSAPVRRRAPLAQPIRRGTETILVVEDEPAILELARIMIEQQGYVVTTASCPGDAIHLANTHSGPIDLLITDVVMPEMNGRELAKRLQSLYPDLKCLFMSGYTANVIAHHGVLDSGVHFIQKPFAMHDLIHMVRSILDKA